VIALLFGKPTMTQVEAKVYNVQVRMRLADDFMRAAHGIANDYNGAARVAQYMATATRHLAEANLMRASL
jgi:hypothetical protein